jgi:hypothetical protein
MTVIDYRTHECLVLGAQSFNKIVHSATSLEKVYTTALQYLKGFRFSFLSVPSNAVPLHRKSLDLYLFRIFYRCRDSVSVFRG